MMAFHGFFHLVSLYEWMCKKIQVSLHYNRQLLCLSCLGYLLNLFALFYTCWIASMNVLYTKTIQNYPKLLCVSVARTHSSHRRKEHIPPLDWCGGDLEQLELSPEAWGNMRKDRAGDMLGIRSQTGKKNAKMYSDISNSVNVNCQRGFALGTSRHPLRFNLPCTFTPNHTFTRETCTFPSCAFFLVSWWGHKYDFVSLPCCLVKTWIEQTSDFVYPKVQCKPLEPQNFPGMTLECKQDSGAKSDTCFKCLSVAIHFARHLQVTPVPGLARRTPIPSPSNAAPKHLRSNSGWVAIFFGTYR